MPDSETQYRLLPVIQTPNVNPGETALIGLYITGEGPVERQKLYINFSNTGLVHRDSPGEIQFGAKEAFHPVLDGPFPVTQGETQVMELEYPGTSVDARPFLRSHQKTDQRIYQLHQMGEIQTNVSDLQLDTPEHMYPGRTGEASYEGNPPFLIRINTREKVLPGDYSITMTLTYGNSEVKQASEKATIHVNNLREKYEPCPTIVAVIAGMAAVLSLIFQTGFFDAIIN